MLGKLLKHEWKSVGRLMGAVNLAIIVITVLGCFMLNLGILETPNGPLIASLLMSLYGISLITFGFVVIIYLYVRFYRNLYTEEGYLMHTLPVTPAQLLHSKLLVGYFWIAVNGLLIILSIITLIYAAYSHAASIIDMEDFQLFFQPDGVSIPLDGATIRLSFQDIIGYTPFQFILLLLLMQLISSFSTLLMGYLSILLGQLVDKYKLAATIGFYFALYMANQILSSIMLLIPSIKLFFADMDSGNTNFMPDYFRSLMPAVIITQVISSLIFYIISSLLIRRKPNLD